MMSEYAIKDDHDYEIINGKIYMMSRPNMNHIKISKNIQKILEKYFESEICEVYPEPDVFFDDENNFVPDLVVLCDKNKEGYQGIYGAPDLVIEVLSPSTEMKDLCEKKDVYSKTGVKEYWIVDPTSKKITVYYLENNLLEINNIYYYKTDEELKVMSEDERRSIISSFKSGLFNDLEVKLSAVFKNMITVK